jgi:hypothetical protein
VSQPQNSNELSRVEWLLLGALASATFLAHMLVSGRYGYFVDELYYLACSHHLAWGFVDQAPLIALITWIERVTLGDSLQALRFLPAVASAGQHRGDRRSALSRAGPPAYHERV